MDKIAKFEEEVGVTFYQNEESFDSDDESEEEIYDFKGGVVNE